MCLNAFVSILAYNVKFMFNVCMCVHAHEKERIQEPYILISNYISSSHLLSNA